MRTLCFALLSGIALIGCDDTESTFTASNWNSGSSPATDADGDGYPRDRDCNDDSFVVNPGADEICDGIDNDCDGRIDDEDDSTTAASQRTFYADIDGDGYGDTEGGAVTACEVPEGFVTDDTDCDDQLYNINPGANEICDGIDNDCDGRLDDADDDLDPASAGRYYHDEDFDGFGRNGSMRIACAMLGGYVDIDGDCADLDAQTHPNAAEVCDGIDNNCNSLTDDEDDSIAISSLLTFYADTDSDGHGDPDNIASACQPPVGYIVGAGDCNDGNDEIHPDAGELCDGIDNDCDDLIDDEDSLADGATLLTFYVDADGDGYGNVENTNDSCGLTEGHVEDATDCDDSNTNVNPEATEICDGIDNNCDGLTDDDDPDSLNTTTFYADDDSDGYGDAGRITEACEAPDGHVSDSTDCDDTDDSIHPGAWEVCDLDGLALDNDCDGLIDDRDDDLVDGDVFYRDFDEDGFGHNDYSITACTAPDRYSEVDGDCDDEDAASHPDAMEQCDGADNDCDGEIDQAWISEDFEGSIEDLTATGDLTLTSDENGNYILLSSASNTDEVSTIFFDELVPGGAWSVAMTVSMDDGDGNAEGEGGMTIAFLTETDPGVLGEALGVGGLSGYAIELDISEDDDGDPNGNHLALIETDTMTHLSTVTDIPTLEGAGEIEVVVVFDAQTLEVYLDGVLMMSEILDEEISDEVLIGVTASSGDPGVTQTLDTLIIGCP